MKSFKSFNDAVKAAKNEANQFLLLTKVLTEKEKTSRSKKRKKSLQ